jgi:hypothetical protein
VLMLVFRRMLAPERRDGSASGQIEFDFPDKQYTQRNKKIALVRSVFHVRLLSV